MKLRKCGLCAALTTVALLTLSFVRWCETHNTVAGISEARAQLLRTMGGTNLAHALFSAPAPNACPEKPEMWLLYHGCEGLTTVRDLNARIKSVMLVRTLQMKEQVLCDKPSRPDITLQHTMPFFAQDVWQSALAENAALVALGRRVGHCPLLSGAGSRTWVGTASWKAFTAQKIVPRECHNLEYVLEHFDSQGQLPDDVALYWWDVENPSTKPHSAELDPRGIFTEQLAVIYTFFEEVLGLDSAAMANDAKSEAGLPLPWANWLITSPRVMALLGKLQALFYAWLEMQHPLLIYHCGPATLPNEVIKAFEAMKGSVGNLSYPRCWSYFGEVLTILFLTSYVDLRQVECAGTAALRFHTDGRGQDGSALQKVAGAIEAAHALVANAA